MQICAYSRLESHNLLISHSIGLGNDWNQVDLGMESAHNFDVQRLQRMASWLDEVHTSVDSVIHNIHAVDLVLRIQICIKALLYVIHNWSPRFVIVNEVTKTRSIDNSQS